MQFTLRLLASAAILSLISYLAARAQPNQGYVPIWPAGGVGLALVWRYGARYWPAILAANTVMSVSVGTPLPIALGVGWLQVLLVMVALYLLERWEVSRFLPDLRQLGAFLVALLAATALSMPIYGMRMALVFGYAPWRAFAFGLDYFVSGLLSFLIFTPLLVSWSPRVLAKGPNRWLLAGGLIALALGGMGVLAADPGLRDRLLYLMLPFVVLCALAARIGGASAASALLAMIIIATGREPVPIVDSILHSLFALISTLTGYLLAAVFSERERAATEMNFRARHDVLTGLMNRYEFENRMATALRDTGRGYALLYLDLDQFKLVNDTCGHLAGDHMLRQLAQTIEQALPAGAMLARLGGDEFGCLLPDADATDAERVAARLHDVIRAFEFSVGALRFGVGVSIGTTFFRAGEDTRPDDVLARADIACYAAKEHGRNRTHVYNPADSEMHSRHAEIQRVSQIKADLASGAFRLYAQRIIDLRDDAPDQPLYEVLLNHAQATAANESIEEVLGMAQRYGLMAQVDHWVLEHAAGFLGRASSTPLRLSVNVAATTLESAGFEDFLIALPQRHAFAPQRLMLEITEAIAVQNLTRAVETLRRLRERGFGVALDDFGAGVASFGYLHDLPVSMVKIDGRFVRDLGKDPTAEVVIESLSRVAALRGIACAAEWVEDLDLLPRLRQLGIAYAQGFAIHRPEPLAGLAMSSGKS